jgi:hypothetical protein
MDTLYPYTYSDVQRQMPRCSGPGSGSRRVFSIIAAWDDLFNSEVARGFHMAPKSIPAQPDGPPSKAMIIRCSKLTTCGALDDGETIKLEFLDESRNPVSLLLSFEHAESIAMTLSQLLTQAVKAQPERTIPVMCLLSADGSWKELRIISL